MISGIDLHQFDVYNDGYFAHLPLTYVDGVILEIAVSRMPYEQLAEFLEEKCGCYFQGLYYQVPSQDLERGLVRVSDDRSTSYMFDVEETFGRLTLYLDHLDMNLSEYLSQVITYDMDDLVSKKIGPPKMRYLNDFSVDEIVDWAEMEVETEGVEARTSTTEGVEAKNSTTEGVEVRNSTTKDVEARTSTKDKGKEKVSEVASDVVETRRCTVEVDSETEMKANRKTKAKAKDKPDEEMNEPNEENSMPTDNVRGETFEEHDIYMNELLKNLKAADKDGITKDPFISVEKHVERYPMYDETTHWRLRKPKVGEKYTSVAQFKECLTYYALANGFSLCRRRPSRVYDPEKGKQKKQTKYPCASSDDLPKCLWRCYARWMTDEKTFQCISLVDEHTCVRNFNFGALVNYKWIAKIFGNKIRANPDIRLCDIVVLVMKKYKCKVSLNQCTNAKKYALTEYEKSIGEHYFMLRSYGKAILDSNLGSTIKLGVTVNPDGKTYFDSPNQGEILTAIEREDLGCSRGNGLTQMSDQHKGFIEVVKDVMPNAEHRQCARHIYKNFRKQYLSLEYRQLLRAASKSSYPQLFNKIMDKIKSANPNAHKYLMDKNPKTWLRAFFEVDKGCEAIENGFSDCFNSVIVNVRHKPLLTMLEAIRVIVLERMNKLREISRKWNPGFWHVIPAGGNLFEVRSGSKGFTVDEGKRTCSCRMWQLSGLPCVHATKEIFLINKSMYSTVLPSKPRKMPGRPRKKRIRAIGEGVSLTKVSKVGSQGSCSNCKKPRRNKSSCKELVVEQTPKLKGVAGRPRKKQLLDDFENVDVVQRGPVRDEGASKTRRGAGRSRGGASGSIGRGVGGSGGASGLRGRGVVGSRGGAGGSIGKGVSGSKRKHVSTAGTQKRQGKKKVETSAFAKWFGLQDEPEQTQAEPQQTQHELEQTQLKTKWSRLEIKLR
ncbi:multidrug resistance-associated protein 5 [Tanacetum coccineum]|uniref:Multidrug resistance-associated protein 5 n=1 Tax=Tanacetum coccineum TaxID=301880 RepID=A0ABQ5E527_9ASTR